MTSTLPTARPKPWGEALATFFTCLALGPPIGALVFTFGVFIVPSLAGVPHAAGTGYPDYLLSAIWVSLFAVPFSYLIGGLQAAATGLAFAGFGWLKGRPPFWFAALTAGGVYLGAMIGGMAESNDMLAVMFFVHAVPAVLCWAVVRNFWRREPA